MKCDQPVDLRSRLLATLQSLTPCYGNTVFVGGAGCAGKSTLAIELADRFRSVGADPVILDLDCYLMSRADRERLNPPASPYDPRCYTLDVAKRDILSLLQGRRIMTHFYDKRTGLRRPPSRLDPGGVLLVEGSMALQSGLSGITGLRFYLHATDAVLLSNRVARESGFGVAPALTRAKFASLDLDYKLHILTQRSCADLCAAVGEGNRITSIERACQTVDRAVHAAARIRELALADAGASVADSGSPGGSISFPTP